MKRKGYGRDWSVLWVMLAAVVFEAVALYLIVFGVKLP